MLSVFYFLRNGFIFLLFFIFLIIAVLTRSEISLWFKLVSPQLLLTLSSFSYTVLQMYVICREIATTFIVCFLIGLFCGVHFLFLLLSYFVFTSYSEANPIQNI